MNKLFEKCPLKIPWKYQENLRFSKMGWNGLINVCVDFWFDDLWYIIFNITDSVTQWCKICVSVIDITDSMKNNDDWPAFCTFGYFRNHNLDILHTRMTINAARTILWLFLFSAARKIYDYFCSLAPPLHEFSTVINFVYDFLSTSMHGDYLHVQCNRK